MNLLASPPPVTTELTRASDDGVEDDGLIAVPRAALAPCAHRASIAAFEDL
jgi:hypothetical protein